MGKKEIRHSNTLVFFHNVVAGMPQFMAISILFVVKRTPELTEEHLFMFLLYNGRCFCRKQNDLYFLHLLNSHFVFYAQFIEVKYVNDSLTAMNPECNSQTERLFPFRLYLINEIYFFLMGLLKNIPEY